MKKYFFIISAILFWTILSPAQWQPDVRLTNDPAQSYMSNPNKHCIASSGNVLHVVWHDERTNWNIYYKCSTDAGLTWSTDTRLSTGSAQSHESGIALSGSVLHVIWHDNRDGNWEIYYKRSTDAGINWGSDTRLTNNSFQSTTASIAVSGSNVHVVWQDDRDGNIEIYYKRSTDGGINWGTDTRLTNDTSVSVYPSVTVSGSAIHAVWYDGRDGNYEIYYKRSTDGGISWGADTRLSATPFVSELATVAVSGSIVHVVWQDMRDGNYEIYYKRSTDGGLSWGTDTRMTNNSAESFAPNLTLSGSNIHLTWQDARDGNFEIYYKRSTDGGISWGTDTRLTNASGSSVRSFSTVTGTAVHVVWMDERDGNWEIYYKQDPTGNPGPPTPPAPPNLVSPPNGSFNEPTTIRFIWNKSLNAITYRIQIAQDSLFSNIVVNDSTLTDTTIVVANLLVNKYYWWRVNAKNAAGTSQYSAVWRFGTFPVGLKEIGNTIPNIFKLYANYPNPFNPSTSIKFDIPKESNVKLVVYDVLGKEISILINYKIKAGRYEVWWDGTDHPSGVYFFRMITNEYVETKKMVLIK